MNILFISHDAQRAGAQMQLLLFLKWLKKNKPNIRFDILLAAAGPLLEEYEKAGRVYRLPRNKKKSNLLIQWRLNQKKKALFQTLSRNKYDLIYNSTIVNGHLLHELSFLNLPVITDANELDFWIDKSGKKNMEYIARYTKHYITASQSVADCLIKRGYAIKDNAEPNYVIVDMEKISDASKLRSLHKELSIPKNALIIGSCGAEVFRKGKDLFLHIANDILSREKDKDIHFVWIGGTMSEDIQFDWDRSPYASRIHFMDHTPHATTYFHEFDIFLMLSRDDPFPIVNVEVGVWGVPVVCFEDTGGATELIGNEGGISVPYGDLRAYGNAVSELIIDEEKRKRMGQFLKEKVANNYGIDKICTRLDEIIERVTRQTNNDQ